MTINESALAERASQVLERYRALQRSLPTSGGLDAAAVQEMLQELALALQESEGESRHDGANGSDASTRAEQEVALEQARYSELMEFCADGCVYTDVRGVIKEANAAASALLGVPLPRLLGKPLPVFVVFADRPRFRSFLNRLRTGAIEQYAHELTMIGRTDGSFPAKVRVARALAPDGGAAGLRWMVTNVSARAAERDELSAQIAKRQRTEQVLRHAEERYRHLVEYATDIIYELDHGGRFIYCNASATQHLLGYNPQELLGRRLADIVPHHYRQRVAKFLRLLATNKTHVSYLEFPVTAKAGNLVWLGQHATVIDHGEKRHGLQAVCRDVSGKMKEIARAGEKIRDFSQHLQAQIENERARIARDIHDELGAALTGLKMEFAPATRKLKGAKYAVDRRRNSAKLMRRIDAAIDATRRICSDLRPSLLDNMGLCAAIEWLCEDAQHRSSLRFEATLEGLPREMDAQRSIAVFRIVQEAITNALRHAGATKVTVTQYRRGGNIAITVRDDGCGITPTQRVATRSFGLMGMYERARAFGGRLQIDGSRGGTRVSLRMPMADTLPNPEPTLAR